MMTKKKTPRLLRVKFVLILPVLALLVYAFAEPSYRVKDTEPMGKEIAIEAEVSEKTLKISGKVAMIETGEPIPGATVLIKGSTVGTVVDIDGSFKLVDPNPKVESNGGLQTTLVISFVGLRTIEKTFGISGQNLKKGETLNLAFKMEEEVIVIHNETYTGAVPPPPPPKVVEVPMPLQGEREVFYVVEEMPKYPGGYAALQEYLAKMQAKIGDSKKVKGKAKIGFTVNQKGKVTDIKIIEKDNDGAAKGAYIIAKEMKGWKPGKQRGKPVPVKYMMPIEFK